MASIEEALLSARVVRPYYQRILAALVPVAEERCPTVAVDQWGRLYYSPSYLEGLTPDQAGHVIGAHEAEHILRDHFSRAKRIAAEPQRWNIAGDAAINDEPGVTEHLPCGCVHPKLFGWKEGLLEEDYYDKIQVQKVKCGVTCSGGSGAGVPQEWEKQSPGDGGPAGQEPDDMERLRDSVALDVISHAKAHGRGSVPGSALMWAEARVSPPRVDWRRELSACLARGVASSGRADYSWERTSRRGLSMGVTLPGTIKRKLRLGLVVDTSGSMSNLGPLVLSEVSAIARGWDVKVWSCDAAPLRVHGLKFTGGGGTDLRPGIKRASVGADMVIVLTDGDTPWPEQQPETPLHILILGEGTTPTPTYAKTIRIKNENK